VREPIDQTQSYFKATLEKDQVSQVDLDRRDTVELRRIHAIGARIIRVKSGHSNCNCPRQENGASLRRLQAARGRSHSAICEPFNACRASRKTCSRTAPCGSNSACSRKRFASSDMHGHLGAVAGRLIILRPERRLDKGALRRQNHSKRLQHPQQTDNKRAAGTKQRDRQRLQLEL